MKKLDHSWSLVLLSFLGFFKFIIIIYHFWEALQVLKKLPLQTFFFFLPYCMGGLGIKLIETAIIS